MPRQLTVSVPVRAPRGFTIAFAWTYFQERSAGATPSGLPLRLPLDAIARGLSVNEPVAVEVRYVGTRDAKAEPDALEISWSPTGTAAFPSFNGTMHANAEGDSQCRLAIRGGYTPPGGIAGAAFDAVLGRRIAEATVTAMLERLRVAAEADYRLRTAL